MGKVLPSDEFALAVNSSKIEENEGRRKIYIYKGGYAQMTKRHPRLEAEPIELCHMFKH